MTDTAEYDRQSARTRGTRTAAYAALSATSPIEPFAIERREPRPNDVAIEILYCGVCHSDIHQARDEWGGSIFPMVPGHEIVGRVTSVGADVTKFKVGDLAGVGCMVDSCRVCANCKDGEEQYCNNPHATYTYNGRDKNGEPTYGGYSTSIVVDEDSCCTSPTSWTRGHGAAALRRHHDVFAAAGTGRSARARSSASSDSAGSGTWG